MNYLLDTHIFLWAIFSPEKISKNIKKILADRENIKYVSSVTFWEISLKFSKRKIDLQGILPDQFPGIAINDGFEILQLDENVTSSFFKLPKIKNKDPFDRMLAWQAICNNYILLTQDKSFMEYEDQNLKVVH